jgi:hypothetical protein
MNKYAFLRKVASAALEKKAIENYYDARDNIAQTLANMRKQASVRKQVATNQLAQIIALTRRANQ